MFNCRAVHPEPSGELGTGQRMPMACAAARSYSVARRGRADNYGGAVWLIVTSAPAGEARAVPCPGLRAPRVPAPLG
jgi:hypothetical protein